MPAVQCSASTAARSAAPAPARTESSVRSLGQRGRSLPAPMPLQREHQQNRADGRREKRQPHILLEKQRHANGNAAGESPGHARLSIEILQQPKRNQNPERAVAVVLRIGHDAVNPDEGERRGDDQRHRPCGCHAPAQRLQARCATRARSPARPPLRHTAHDERRRGPSGE